MVNILGLKKDNQIKIFETTDYDQFKKILGNRTLERGHIAKLTKSILKNNMLAQNPILVNADMEVIDGQHRLEVAKANKLSIYYTIVMPGTLKEVQQLNFAQKQWTMEDYFKSYCELKNPHYLKLRDFIKDTGLSISNAGLLIGNTNRNIAVFTESRASFKMGKFTITNFERGERFKGYFEDLQPYIKEARINNDRQFIACLIKIDNLIDEGLLDWNRMLEKFIQSGYKIERMFRARDYLRFFEDVYNFKIKNPDRIF